MWEFPETKLFTEIHCTVRPIVPSGTRRSANGGTTDCNVYSIAHFRPCPTVIQHKVKPPRVYLSQSPRLTRILRPTNAASRYRVAYHPAPQQIHTHVSVIRFTHMGYPPLPFPPPFPLASFQISTEARTRRLLRSFARRLFWPGRRQTTPTSDATFQQLSTCHSGVNAERCKR